MITIFAIIGAVALGGGLIYLLMRVVRWGLTSWRSRRFASEMARVDGLIQRVEARAGGAVHPIRAVPMDMVTTAVLANAGPRPTDGAVMRALQGVLIRYDGHPSAIDRYGWMSNAVDEASIYRPSSYVPHDGVARLRDGG